MRQPPDEPVGEEPSIEPTSTGRSAEELVHQDRLQADRLQRLLPDDSDQQRLGAAGDKRAAPDSSLDDEHQIKRARIDGENFRISLQSSEAEKAQGNADPFAATNGGNSAGGAAALKEDANPCKNFNAVTRAVWKGERNTDMLKAIIAADPTLVNQPDGNGALPLNLAVTHGDIKVVMLLLENGADTEARDFSNKTALQHAAWNNKPKLVDELLKYDANLLLDDLKASPLVLACMNKTASEHGKTIASLSKAAETAIDRLRIPILAPDDLTDEEDPQASPWKVFFNQLAPCLAFMAALDPSPDYAPRGLLRSIVKHAQITCVDLLRQFLVPDQTCQEWRAELADQLQIDRSRVETAALLLEQIVFKEYEALIDTIDETTDVVHLAISMLRLHRDLSRQDPKRDLNDLLRYICNALVLASSDDQETIMTWAPSYADLWKALCKTPPKEYFDFQEAWNLLMRRDYIRLTPLRHPLLRQSDRLIAAHTKWDGFQRILEEMLEFERRATLGHWTAFLYNVAQLTTLEIADICKRLSSHPVLLHRFLARVPKDSLLSRVIRVDPHIMSVYNEGLWDFSKYKELFWTPWEALPRPASKD